MINTSKIEILRFFRERFNLKKASYQNKSIILINILWVSGIIIHLYNPSVKWDK